MLEEALLIIKPYLPDLRNVSYSKKPNILTFFLIAEIYI
jgi:hypothetical protein